MEYATHEGESAFVTLTYDNDSLPVTLDHVPTLRKRSFLNWVRSSRRAGGFRYYAVGEYGELSLRPHYHMAVFCEPGVRIGEILERWRSGFVQSSPLNLERARYLAAYTAKKLTKADDERLEPDQEPEFRTSSKRPPLGAAFVEVAADRWLTHGKGIIDARGDVERTFRVDGRIFPFDEWALKQIRSHCGIPLLHRERAEHPAYLEWHETQEAIFDEQELKRWEINHGEKRKQRLYRSTTQRL